MSTLGLLVAAALFGVFFAAFGLLAGSLAVLVFALIVFWALTA